MVNCFTPFRACSTFISSPVLSLFLSILISASVLAQDIEIQEIGDRMAVISGTGTNILVKQSANGDVMVVDGGLEEYSRQTLDAIDDLLSENWGNEQAMITLLINTHWHPEQTGLNAFFGNNGATIFAHENTRQWLTTPITRPWENSSYEPLPTSSQPSETFYHFGEMDHSGTTVQYGYLRQAHTDGDMYVYFPEENVLHGGGAIANDVWPLMDWWTGGWIGGLANGLEVLLEIVDDETIIVPANGALMNKADLLAMREMYAAIFQRISGGFRAANSIDDTLSDEPTAEFNDQYGDPEAFIRRSHESLIPHYTPDA
jgi:glyoxylase-like metal-dependent hydrolase (beta-lactamase superfamily II)